MLPGTKEVAAGLRLGTAKRVPLASMEASLGPALGSLGVILEADEEMGSEADEGESAPAALTSAKPAPAKAARSADTFPKSSFRMSGRS